MGRLIEWMIVGLLVCFSIVGCNSDQVQPTASSQNVTLTAQTHSVILASSPSPTNVPSGSVLSTLPPPTIEPTSIPSSIPTPTPSPKIAVYVPERWREAAIAAFRSPSLITDVWDWQLVDKSNEADIVMAEGPGEIGAGERPIALIVPFTNPIEELTVEEAQQYLMVPGSGFLAADWDDIPTGFKALRVGGLLPDDDGYALKQYWSLRRPGVEYDMETLSLGSALAEQLSRRASIHLAAVGDIMLDRSLGFVIETGDLQYPFSNVADTLSKADIAVGNLESSLGNTGEPVEKSYNFQAPPEAARSLALAGFDVMSLANNHALDFGPPALLQAIDLLEENGIRSVGAGANLAFARQPVLVDENGVRVAFLAYVDVPVEISGFDTQTWEAGVETPGLAWAHPDTIIQDVRSAKAIADVVVVILHSGYEFLQQPSPPQIGSAQAAIDAGASLVIGHHSHLLQGVAFYQGGVIVYGLSNFAFEMEGSRDSAILNVWLDKDGVSNLEIIPITIGPGGQPGYATPGESRRIREEVYRLTELLNQP
ncbi:MAG: CapA family protein [Candidatus Promineifilaceae bacterium]